MTTQTDYVTPARHANGQSRSALRFFAVAASVVLLSTLVWALLFRLFGRPTVPARLFPPAFWVSSALLLAGSLALSKAMRFVRREQQRPFRQWLLIGLVLAALFMGVQTYGLVCLVPHDRTATEASTGVTAFVLALSALHAMHFIIATLGLSLVTVRALADRYDHEYHWGVSVVSWFWHALGLIWCAILVVFAIVA